MRHAKLLARGVHADAALEIQPVRAGMHAELFPVAALVELADQVEEPAGGRVQAGRQRGDFVGDPLARIDAGTGDREEGGVPAGLRR